MWPRGGMVTQRIANPFIPVRFWAWPPINLNMNSEILKIALDTKNNCFLDKHTHFTKLKNSTCGDQIKVYLNIKKRKILEFKYEGEFCIYCKASANLLSRSLKNKNFDKLELLLKCANNKFNNENIPSISEFKKLLKIMNKSNIQRKNCLLLPIKATLLALKK